MLQDERGCNKGNRSFSTRAFSILMAEVNDQLVTRVEGQTSGSPPLVPDRPDGDGTPIVRVHASCGNQSIAAH
jgi:hypothetical protein